MDLLMNYAGLLVVIEFDNIIALMIIKNFKTYTNFLTIEVKDCKQHEERIKFCSMWSFLIFVHLSVYFIV